MGQHVSIKQCYRVDSEREGPMVSMTLCVKCVSASWNGTKLRTKGSPRFTDQSGLQSDSGPL